MRFVVALIGSILLTSPMFGEVSLRLIATPAMVISGAHTEAQIPVFGDVFIENCGSETVTIPTWVPGPDGTSGSSIGAGAAMILYRFAFKTNCERKLIPSEAAFHTVRLAPGERTQLPTWHLDVLEDKKLDVRVVYKVEKDIGDHFGWWTGTIQCDGEKPK